MRNTYVHAELVPRLRSAPARSKLETADVSRIHRRTHLGIEKDKYRFSGLRVLSDITQYGVPT